MAKEKHQCSGNVWAGMHSYPCSRNAKYLEDGKWYCGVHRPGKIEARQEKYHEIWRLEIEIGKTENKIQVHKANIASIVQEYIERPLDQERDITLFMGNLETECKSIHALESLWFDQKAKLKELGGK